jgi:two-component system LytT family response regulator
MPELIRTLVIDDEAPARKRLVDLLVRDPSVSTVEEGADGVSAIHKITQQQPDLVFLDVQMPELDGLEVMQRVGIAMPLTVFVTAYDQHAIRAFEADAVDYLLKPFSDERFEATMARIKTRLQDAQLRVTDDSMHRPALTTAQPASPPLDMLLVKTAAATRLIRTAEVDWIEAAGVYVTLHVAGKELLYRAALNDLAIRLNPVRFVRVHRSAIVNVERIVHLEPISHGEFDAVLRSGARVRVSRTYRTHLERRLGQSL